MENNIKDTLASIRQQTSVLNRVAFMFHCWSPFNNLNTDGYRIPAIQSATIPRMTLLPIVSVNVDLFSSTKSPSTNKVIPVIQRHTRPIEATNSIVVQRYGKFGMILINSLECTLEEAEEYIQYFDRMMLPFKQQGGRLQDLPEYFGAESPVVELFEKRTVRVTTNAHKTLDDMFRGGLIPERAYHKFLAAIQEFAKSAITAHRYALLPGYGMLQESIQAVNEGNKARFDGADEFAIREFPDFNSDSKISKRSAANDTAALVDVFKQFLAAQTQQPLVQAPVAPSSESPDASKTVPEVKAVDLPPAGEVAAVPLDPAKCQALKKDATQCGQKPREGFKTCENVMHQQQLGEFAEPVNA